ncbi:unnamed protein product [Effrenium voratum]|uniref:Mur ligase C-terminal domain-containing protein n=1 Tax=Effrenium voratum TaxID=2562239 RepID=A0AA36IL75_9DINO|nr:unnamed protein product [Effrenium voratum]CAJ1413141.1 unnamed protein product [Effrenium voratum]
MELAWALGTSVPLSASPKGVRAEKRLRADAPRSRSKPLLAGFLGLASARARRLARLARAEDRLETTLSSIESQLRKQDSIVSSCGLSASYANPTKSTPAGLKAMEELENLVNSFDEELELPGGDDRLARALAACFSEHTGEALDKTLETLRQKSDHGQQCLDDADADAVTKLSQYLKVGSGGRPTLDEWVQPPPSDSDAEPTAQNARYPLLAAIQQVSRLGRSGLGSSEAASLGRCARRRGEGDASRLDEVLSGAGAASATVFGDPKVTVLGLVDVLDRAQPGDLLVADPDLPLRDVLRAAAHRKVAAVLAEAADVADAEAAFQEFQSESLRALTLRPPTLSSSRLAGAFFGDLGVRHVAVVGAEMEARTASWLLFKMLEARIGADKTGLIDPRRSFIAYDQLEVSRALTPCAVQEMLAGMAEQNIDIAVSQVSPESLHAFKGLDVDLVLDVSSTRSEMGFGSVQKVVGPETRSRNFFASYSSELESPFDTFEDDYGKLLKKELVAKLEAMGVAVPKTAKKSDLLELLRSQLELPPAPEEFAADPQGSNLHVRAQKTLAGGLSVRAAGLGLDAEGTLPRLGACSLDAFAAALCAAQVLAPHTELPDAELAVPALLEVHRGPNGELGILHEASSVEEVEAALRQVRDLTEGQVTAVFGCDGEVNRTERARYAYVLAQLCDRVVLTSSDPRSEPVMQIIEDVLAAIRGYRRWEDEQRTSPLRVYVVADRADAIKLGMIKSKGLGEAPEVTVVFGRAYRDVQEATDEHGLLRAWLCNDRSLVCDALQLAGEVNSENASWVKWENSLRGKRFSLPGRSLHWSYAIEASSDGQLVELM